MKACLSIILSWLLIFANISFAQTSPGKRVDGTIFTGKNILDTNYIKAPQPYNPSDLNSSTTATSSATLTRDATGGNLFQGLPSYQCDTSANAGYCEFKINTPKEPALTGNCAAYTYIKGDGSLYSLQITDGTTARVSAGLSNALSTGYGIPFIVNYPCQATPTVRITQTTAGTSPAINIGWIGYGIATNIGAGVPNNVFSAKVSSTGVVSDLNEPGWLTNFSVSTVEFTGTSFKSGLFNVAPNCTATVNTSGGPTGTYGVRVYSTTNSTVSVSSNSSNTTTPAPFNIICTRASTDFIQPAITPNQWNWGPTSFGTITFGGTTTPPTKASTKTVDDITAYRQGKYMVVTYKYSQPNATGAAIGSGDYILPIPGGYQADTALVSVFTGNIGTGAVAIGAPVSRLDTFGYITDGANRGDLMGFLYSPTQIRLSAQSWYGSAIFFGASQYRLNAGSLEFSVSFRVPIQGWTENQNAPQLLGSVTSDSSNAYRSEFATINNNGTCSIVSSSSGFTSTSKTATGQCSTVVSFGVTPTMCSCTGMRASGPTTCTFKNAVSATSMLTLTQASAADSDQNFYVECKIPR